MHCIRLADDTREILVMGLLFILDLLESHLSVKCLTQKVPTVEFKRNKCTIGKGNDDMLKVGCQKEQTRIKDVCVSGTQRLQCNFTAWEKEFNKRHANENPWQRRKMYVLC